MLSTASFSYLRRDGPIEPGSSPPWPGSITIRISCARCTVLMSLLGVVGLLGLVALVAGVDFSAPCGKSITKRWPYCPAGVGLSVNSSAFTFFFSSNTKRNVPLFGGELLRTRFKTGLSVTVTGNLACIEVFLRSTTKRSGLDKEK